MRPDNIRLVLVNRVSIEVRLSPFAEESHENLGSNDSQAKSLPVPTSRDIRATFGSAFLRCRRCRHATALPFLIWACRRTEPGTRAGPPVRQPNGRAVEVR